MKWQSRMRLYRTSLLGLSSALVSLVAICAPQSQSRFVRIDIQPLDTALNVWAQQTGYSVLVPATSVIDKLSVPQQLVGTFTPEGALQNLLSGTNLRYEFVNQRTVAILIGDSSRVADKDYPAARLTQVRNAEAQSSGVEINKGSEHASDTSSKLEEMRGIPEVVISGSQSLNSDIKRSRDDAQPYVVIDRGAIEHSGASNLDGLLKSQLLMATGSLSAAVQGGNQGAVSKVNLRGLGSDETLILIDGRRAAGFGNSSNPAQPDLNSIPLAAVERIEILPATASGIYGGGATGGVVNVILRHNYRGLETKFSYGGAFDGGATARNVDVAGGANFRGGKTNLMISASWAETEDLLTRDRHFTRRALETVLQNNPASIYGAVAPILGATTNIRSANGTPLTLKSNGQSLGSPITSVPYGYGGPGSDGGTAFLTNAGKYNLDLPRTAQTIPSAGASRPLLSSPTIKSAIGTLKHSFSSWLDAYAEFSASENRALYRNTPGLFPLTIPASATANPFNQTVQISTPALGGDSNMEANLSSLRATTGLVGRLSSKWSIGADYVWHRTRSDFSNQASNMNGQQVAAAIGSGALNVFRDTNAYGTDFTPFVPAPSSSTPADTTLNDATVRVSGYLPQWFADVEPSVTVLLEHRRESLSDQYFSVGGTTTLLPWASQSVDSVYLEALFPLISARREIPAIRLLELQLAARHDQYRIVGTASVPVDANRNPTAQVSHSRNEISSTVPTFALRYGPTRDFTLRASYGRGFRPPAVNQVAGATSITFPFGLFGLTDPLRNNEPLSNTALLVQGGNDQLRPETSESRSAGIIITPRFIDGLRMSVDRVAIKKTGNIAVYSPFPQSNLNDYITFLPFRVTRGVASGGFQVGPITSIDVTYVNLATLDVKSYDIAMDYHFQSANSGEFDIHMGGTRVGSLRTQLAPVAPIVEYASVGTAGNVGGLERDGGALKWNANALISWRFKSYTLGWATRYFDSYFFDPTHTLNPSQGAASVPSQTYHDVFVGYDFARVGNRGSLLEGLQMQLSVTNVFNRSPPVDVVGGGFSSSRAGYSYYGDPRLATYALTLRKSFGGENR